jgi:chromosome segregation ATPase
LDEVDAALDEGNQEMVAKVIAKFFQHSQVFCVSHHTAMQLHSDLLINVQIKNGKTVI